MHTTTTIVQHSIELDRIRGVHKPRGIVRRDGLARIARAVGALAIILLFCLPAEAQKIQRSERESARLEFLGFARKGETIEVGQGELAWAETVRHADVARILVELPDRKFRGFTAGAPAGSILFGYRVSGGVAYCAAPDPTRVNKEAQCLRDLDGDGTFDASQVVEWAKPGDEVFSAFVQHLAAVSKGAYEVLPRTLAAPMEAKISLHDVQSGAPRFKLTVNGRMLSDPIACKPTGAGFCSLFGIGMQFASVNGRLRLTFLDVAAERIFDPYRLANLK